MLTILLIAVAACLVFLFGFVIGSVLTTAKYKDEIKQLNFEIDCLKKANEEMYEKGKTDMVRELSKEIIDDHIINFQKIPKKKFISIVN